MWSTARRLLAVRHVAQQSHRQASTADAVVIGAGIVGASTAFGLAKRGLRVVVLDSNGGPGEGTTSFSSGCLRTFYSVHSAAHLAWESYRFFESWDDLLQHGSECRNGIRLRTCGGMILRTPHSESFLRSCVKTSEALSIPFTVLSQSDLSVRAKALGWNVTDVFQPQRIDDPDFGTPLGGAATAASAITINGAIEFPCTSYVSDPRRATQEMAAAAAKHGAVVLGHHHVTGVHVQNDRVVGVSCVKKRSSRLHRPNESDPTQSKEALPTDSVSADDVVRIDSPVVINCAGPHSSLVHRLVFRECPHLDDIRVRTRALRTEVVIVDAPAGIDYETNGVMLADFDLGLYSRPEFGNRILIGGMEPPCDPLEWVHDHDDPAAIDAALGDQTEHHLHRMALRMPSLTIPPYKYRRGVASTYDVTPDWSPVIDGSKLAGYYMNIGTSGNCFKSAPIMGDMLAAFIEATFGTGVTPSGTCRQATHDDKTSPFRYRTLLTSGEIELSDFSRLRDCHSIASNVMG